MVRSPAITVLAMVLTACSPAGTSTDTQVSDTTLLVDGAQMDVTASDAAGSDLTGDAFAADSASGDGQTGCVDDLSFFKESIWANFMASDCATCHVVGGDAEDSSFILELGDSDLISNNAGT